MSTFHWNAYKTLNRDRPSSEGVLQIPFWALRGYADEYKLEGDEREDFFNVIMAVDNFAVAQANEERRKSEANKPR